MAATAPTVEPLLEQASLITLQTHMLADEGRFPRSNGALSWIVSALSISAKTISARLKRARLENVLGDIGSENIQGESQQKLDVIANEVLIQVLRGRKGVVVIGSEEDEELLCFNAQATDEVGYAVMFDPLDGSANLDVAGSVGTIFSIYEVEPGCAEHLAPGREQIAAGYVLYGSSTIFVITTGDGVHMFVLDPSVGAFIRVAESIRIPDYASMYSVNEGNINSFPCVYRDYLDQCHAAGFSARYAGAMVADVHRVLLRGGIFLYPPTSKAPEGKLRLMYEANPMAMLIEQAGGSASTGSCDIVDVMPNHLHQRVPVILGSSANVAELLAMVHA